MLPLFNVLKFGRTLTLKLNLQMESCRCCHLFGMWSGRFSKWRQILFVSLIRFYTNLQRGRIMMHLKHSGSICHHMPILVCLHSHSPCQQLCLCTTGAALLIVSICNSIVLFRSRSSLWLTAVARPGRWGSVIDMRPRDGSALRRLFRASRRTLGQQQMPGVFGVDLCVRFSIFYLHLITLHFKFTAAVVADVSMSDLCSLLPQVYSPITL